MRPVANAQEVSPVPREGQPAPTRVRWPETDDVYDWAIMSTLRLRREIKKAVDQFPPERLASLAHYVHFLTRPSLGKRLAAAEKAIASGKGFNWRQVP